MRVDALAHEQPRASIAVSWPFHGLSCATTPSSRRPLRRPPRARARAVAIDRSRVKAREVDRVVHDLDARAAAPPPAPTRPCSASWPRSPLRSPRSGAASRCSRGRAAGSRARARPSACRASRANASTMPARIELACTTSARVARRRAAHLPCGERHLRQRARRVQRMQAQAAGGAADRASSAMPRRCAASVERRPRGSASSGCTVLGQRAQQVQQRALAAADAAVWLT